MPLSLGPLPRSLRELIARWIEEGRSARPPTVDPDFEDDALFIYGGPTGCCYLMASGELLSWDAWEDVVTTMDDGPDKMGIIVIAAQHRPELAAWLPVRQPNAPDCGTCGGGGWLRPPFPEVICPDCSGLGWIWSEPIAG